MGAACGAWPVTPLTRRAGMRGRPGRNQSAPHPASLLGASVPPAKLRFPENPCPLRFLKTVSCGALHTHRVTVPVCLLTALGDPTGGGTPLAGPVEVSLQALDRPCHSQSCLFVLGVFVWTLCF